MPNIDKRLFIHINWPLCGLTLILFLCGVVNLYSASGFRIGNGMSVDAYYQKQLIWGCIGLLGMIGTMFFDYRHLSAIAWPLFWITVALLMAVLCTGKTIYGARRWLDLGFISFQPSEIAKISTLILSARILSMANNSLGFTELSFMISIGLIPAGLVIIQPDLGSGLSILLLLSGLILYRGLTPNVLKTIFIIIPSSLPLAWLGLHDYQKKRIISFLDPATDPLGAGYHILQSEIAIGSGQFWGKGFLAGTQGQLRFLPEKHTDFAVAVFGEEWGLVGMLTLLLIFCSFLYQIVIIAKDPRDLFGSYLATGIFFYFFWQIFINMGMVVGLMPVVGIPLPFISYGGSATLVNFCLIGLALNVSMRRFLFKQN